MFELKTQLQLAEGVGLLNINEEVWDLIEEVGKLINGLSKTLTANDYRLITLGKEFYFAILRVCSCRFCGVLLCVFTDFWYAIR